MLCIFFCILNTVSPHDILKSHLVQLIDVTTTPDRLANGLFAANLIPYPVKDRVLSQQNLSHQDKASILVNQVLKSLSAFKDPKTLISFCDVLKNQDDPNLIRIANTMLGDLGKHFCSIITNYLLFTIPRHRYTGNPAPKQ